jgi:hypothetical protein
MKYGIIGSGSANTKVVQEGLIDILKSDDDAVFIIHARRAPQGAVSDVYDFLVDHKVPFNAVTRIDDKAPQGLLNFAMDVITNDDPTKTIINECDEVLLLWSSEEASEKLAIMSADAGKSIKDLTMALTPIVIEGSPETVNMDVIEPEIVYEKPVAHDPDETTEGTPFTRDELMNMNIGVLRRQAKALGVENIGKTKQEIVDAIFYHEPVDGDDAPVVSADTVATEIVEPLNVTQGQLTWIEDGVLQSVMLGENFTKQFLADLRYKPI